MGILETEIHGHALVILENDLLSLTVAAGKGADIVSFVHRPTGTEFMWRSPAGLDVLLQPAAEIRYAGGWIEAFPNAWSGCTHLGRELTGYGDVWQLPWDYRVVREDRSALQVEFSVQSRELPLFLKKNLTLAAGSSSVRIDETVIHTGDEPVRFTWGHHPNIGRPFLSEECVIELPPCDICDDSGRKIGEWPFLREETGMADLRVIPAYGTSAENRQVFLRHFAEGIAAVRNPRTGLAFRLSWDPGTFTDMVLWRAFDTGWSETFGDHQIVCFFPKRSLHNVADAAAKNETLRLAPGERLQSRIEAGADWEVTGDIEDGRSAPIM